MKYDREKLRKITAFVKANPLMTPDEAAARMQCEKKYVYYARYRSGVTGVKAKAAYLAKAKADHIEMLKGSSLTQQIPIELDETKPTKLDTTVTHNTAALAAASIEIARLNAIINYLEKRLASYGSSI